MSALTLEQRHEARQKLRRIFDDHGADQAQRIADSAPYALTARGLAYDVVIELAKAGVPVRDLTYAVQAVARIYDSAEGQADIDRAAQFVGAVAALAKLEGAFLLSIPPLFALAREVIQ